jgi:hypothetical protein
MCAVVPSAPRPDDPAVNASFHKLNVLSASTVNHGENCSGFWHDVLAIVATFSPLPHSQIVRPDVHDSTTEAPAFKPREPMRSACWRLRAACNNKPSENLAR